MLKLFCLAACPLAVLAMLNTGCRMSAQAGDHLEDRNARSYERARPETEQPPNADAQPRGGAAPAALPAPFPGELDQNKS